MATITINPRGPIAAFRPHIGHYCFWEVQRGNGHDEQDGWGKLTDAGRGRLIVEEHGCSTILHVADLISFETVIAPDKPIGPTFDDLRYGQIIGIVDAYDAVHSEFVGMGELTTHEAYWPNQTHNRWRWWFNDGLTSFARECAPKTAEHWDAIRAHIEKRFGIRFWDNGYHNLHHFCACLNAEEAISDKRA